MASRRLFITGISIASVVAIAGCTSESDTEDDSEDVAASDTGEGPETVVEQYVTAVRDGDVESANEVLYPDSPVGYPLEESDLEEEDVFTSVEVEEVSPKEYVERRNEHLGIEPTESEVNEQDVRERLESFNEEPEIDDTTIVIVAGEDELAVITAIKEGEWYASPRTL